MTILAPDRIDAAEARHRVAGIDFIDALASLDQRAAIGDIAQGPALDGRQPPHLGLDLSRLRRGGSRWRHRARDFFRRDWSRGGDRNRRRRDAKLLDLLAEFGELGGGFRLRLLDLVETIAGLVELAYAHLRGVLDVGLQR